MDKVASEKEKKNTIINNNNNNKRHNKEKEEKRYILELPIGYYRHTMFHYQIKVIKFYYSKDFSSASILILKLLWNELSKEVWAL